MLGPIMASPIARSVAAGLLVLSIIGSAYLKGRSDCAVHHAKLEAKAEKDWAKELITVYAKAYDAGVEAERRNAGRDKKVEEIEDAAAQEPNADAECLSADTVERLRDLQ